MGRLILIISLLFLMGCSSVMTLHRDCNGRIWKVETKGNCKTVITQDGEIVEQDTKQPPLINGLDIPVSAVGL